MKKAILKALVCAVLSLSLSTLSHSADLTIGARTELAMDPHAQWLDTNTSYYNHIYGSLTRIDEKSAIGARSRGELEDSSPTPNGSSTCARASNFTTARAADGRCRRLVPARAHTSDRDQPLHRRDRHGEGGDGDRRSDGVRS